jgi:hypothetical protein
MGAGVSVGAGLPTWNDLLAQLGHQAGISDDESEELMRLDPRDAGAVLSRRFQRSNRSLPQAIQKLITGNHVSPLHQLLASLPVTEGS